LDHQLKDFDISLIVMPTIRKSKICSTH